MGLLHVQVKKPRKTLGKAIDVPIGVKGFLILKMCSQKVTIPTVPQNSTASEASQQGRILSEEEDRQPLLVLTQLLCGKGVSRYPTTPYCNFPVYSKVKVKSKFTGTPAASGTNHRDS